MIVALFAGAAGAAATNALQINIEEENVIFEGATAASCRIQLDAEPGAELLAAIQDGNADILGLELLRLGE